MNRTVMLANLPIKALILHTSLPSGDRYLEAGMQERGKLDRNQKMFKIKIKYVCPDIFSLKKKNLM